MIRNIIFDMGNVLLDYNPDVSLQQFCKSDHARAIIKKELFLGEEWRQGDLGYITNEQRYEGVSKRVPEEYHSELRQVVDHWDICMIPLVGAKEFVNRMKEEGYHLFVLSNASTEFYQYFPRQFEMEIFDGIVVSSDLHIVKPDVRIYQHLLTIYQLKAEECLFIDDVPVNIEASRKVGMNGFVFRDSYEDVYSYLSQCNA